MTSHALRFHCFSRSDRVDAVARCAMRRTNFGLRLQNLAMLALGIFRQDERSAFSGMAGSAQCGNFSGRGDAIRLGVPFGIPVPRAFAMTGNTFHSRLRVRMREEILHGFAMTDRAQFVLLGRCQRNHRQHQHPQRDTIHPLIA